MWTVNENPTAAELADVVRATDPADRFEVDTCVMAMSRAWEPRVFLGAAGAPRAIIQAFLTRAQTRHYPAIPSKVLVGRYARDVLLRTALADVDASTFERVWPALLNDFADVWDLPGAVGADRVSTFQRASRNAIFIRGLRAVAPVTPYSFTAGRCELLCLLAMDGRTDSAAAIAPVLQVMPRDRLFPSKLRRTLHHARPRSAAARLLQAELESVLAQATDASVPGKNAASDASVSHGPASGPKVSSEPAPAAATVAVGANPNDAAPPPTSPSLNTSSIFAGVDEEVALFWFDVLACRDLFNAETLPILKRFGAGRIFRIVQNRLYDAHRIRIARLLGHAHRPEGGGRGASGHALVSALREEGFADVASEMHALLTEMASLSSGISWRHDKLTGDVDEDGCLGELQPHDEPTFEAVQQAAWLASDFVNVYRRKFLGRELLHDVAGDDGDSDATGASTLLRELELCERLKREHPEHWSSAPTGQRPARPESARATEE